MTKARFGALILGCACAAAAMATPAHAQARTDAVSLDALIRMVERGTNVWPTARVLEVVTPQCISFAMNTANINRLRAAGAEDALITGLRNVCNTTAAPTTGTQGPRTPPQGVLEITGYLPPGWTRAVNLLEPNTNRTVTLTVDFPGTIVVNAPGWCPDTMQLTIRRQGERHEWSPKLRPRPWVGGCARAQ